MSINCANPRDLVPPPRPPLRYRLRYLWPPNRWELHSRLWDAVWHGVLTEAEAIESYRRETWIVTNERARAFLLCNDAFDCLLFFGAANLRTFRRGNRVRTSRRCDRKRRLQALGGWLVRALLFLLPTLLVVVAYAFWIYFSNTK